MGGFWSNWSLHIFDEQSSVEVVFYPFLRCSAVQLLYSTVAACLAIGIYSSQVFNAFNDTIAKCIVKKTQIILRFQLAFVDQISERFLCLNVKQVKHVMALRFRDRQSTRVYINVQLCPMTFSIESNS